MEAVKRKMESKFLAKIFNVADIFSVADKRYHFLIASLNLITTFVMLVTFTHTTLDMLLNATSIKHASGLILGKQRCRLWHLTIGKNYHDIKDLNPSIFPRKAKQYLLRKQM